MDLNGKTVLLTGASTGLGPHIAHRLDRAGARFVLSARHEQTLARLARQLRRARIVVADLSRKDGPERLANDVGRVDVLVSNAGVPAGGRLALLDVAEIDRAIAINLRSGILLARLLAPSMVRRGSGHMVFMSSMAGRFSIAGASVYNATKFGLRGFALALRQELSASGVGVSVICPTFVSKEGMWARSGLSTNPLAGETRPDAVADAVCTAITKNLAEVDLMGLPLRAGLIAEAVAPGLVATVGRMTGALRLADEYRRRERARR